MNRQRPWCLVGRAERSLNPVWDQTANLPLPLPDEIALSLTRPAFAAALEGRVVSQWIYDLRYEWRRGSSVIFRNRGLAMDGEKKKPMVSDAGAWAMNVVSAVGLIMANKQLMSNSGYGFSFGTPALLTCLSSSISKLSIIPVVCLMEYFLHSKHYSSRVIMAVTAVALGVSICTVTDVEIKAKGLLCACVAVVIAIVFGFTVLQSFILVSCILAVFCNTSQYLCIGRFSATSFQVLGHMKTVCVLVLGWLLFDSVLTLKNILGMLLAVVGMVVYSWAVEHEKKAKVSPDIRVDSKLDGGVEKLLGKGSGVATSDIELARSES
ncbi:hypothetical protein GW17_00025665 [Ensete ventricosum]|nr:hypothetical protein GW17_00025665 [Ensete ventricosum]